MMEDSKSDAKTTTNEETAAEREREGDFQERFSHLFEKRKPDPVGKVHPGYVNKINYPGAHRV